jgi:lipopolysaccharide transport system ATP-binding protein
MQAFWALRDVSFAISDGERVGIIGSNGAGKSTLLKLLARVSAPTTGSIRVRGRVASLLEVGTGFHPELSGRENVFLYGALLGMRRREIVRKFDAIVDFAGVERFLDTPVKRYSSGMYLRLAFSVAAHLDAEIVIVDEALAVGDAEFQEKCLRRMDEMARENRSLLYVSHQMATIRNLCTSCLVLRGGRLDFHGPTEAAIRRHLDNSTVAGSRTELDDFRPGWARRLIASVSFRGQGLKHHARVPLGGAIEIEMTVAVEDAEVKNPVMGVEITSPMFGPVGAVTSAHGALTAGLDATGGATMICRFERLPLVQGRYAIHVWLSDGNIDVDCIRDWLELEIDGDDVYGSGRLPDPANGIVLLMPTWSAR